MSVKRFIRLSTSLLLGLVLAGCDIAGSQNISGSPLGGPVAGGGIDPTNDNNLTAYFYAGKPVKGLIYNCSFSGIAQYTGLTDENGKFVCPRNTLATFFVGQAGVAAIRIGKIELEIFGTATDADRRNGVAITPGTLYGTTVDGSRREIQNIFNLLVSLDTLYAAGDRRQSIIDLEATMMTAAAGSPAFEDLQSAEITALPSLFSLRLAALVNDIKSPAHMPVLANARPGAPTLDSAEATALANESLLRARSGLYRTSVILVDAVPTGGFIGNTQFLVGSGGTISGFATTEEFSTASSSATPYVFSLLQPDPAARILPAGDLQGFTFGGAANQLDLVGTLINDALWAESQVCQADTPNKKIPAIYCSTPEVSGGFSVLDPASYTSNKGFDGDLYVYRPLETLPDIDLDNLPADYLPRTFEMELSRYTDIQRADVYNTAYDGIGEDKTAFGPLTALPAKLRYTLMPNGDIVSDVDADCSDLEIVDGRYRDVDGSAEYLIGRIGNAFAVDLNHPPTTTVAGDDSSFLTMQFAVLDAAHPYYGLTIGFSAIKREGLFPLVLVQSTGNVTSKSCNPASTTICNDKVEWFNDVVFMRDVYAPDNTSSTVTASDELLYKSMVYYGQVSGNQAVSGAGGICPP